MEFRANAFTDGLAGSYRILAFWTFVEMIRRDRKCSLAGSAERRTRAFIYGHVWPCMV